MRKLRTLKVLKLRRLLDATQAVEIPNVRPRSLEVHGQRMDLATAVTIDGQEVQHFAALNPSTLLVEVPTSLTGSITSIAVFSEALQPGVPLVASFDFTTSPRGIEGPFRTLQMFVKYLLTTPGSDIFDPEVGGGIRNLTSRNISNQDAMGISGDFETRVLNTARLLIARQSSDPSLPRTERLLSVAVKDLTLSAAQGGIMAKLDFRFHDGSAVTTSFGW